MIRNSIFSGNVKKSSGSSIQGQKAVISNSKFKNNKAKYGGAIFSPVLRIKNSRFTKNSATYGGAINIHNIYTLKKSMIYKCTFTKNTAKKNR